MGQKCSIACATSYDYSVSQTTEFTHGDRGAKILFLDVDGVLHPYAGQEEFSRSCMDLLAQIIKATSAEIVLSTAWRLQPTAKTLLEQQLQLAGLPRPIGCTPEVIRHGSKKMWKFCGVQVSTRALEIEAWLSEHMHLVDFPRWVAIDDIDMRAELEHHMVLTDRTVGLTQKDAARAIRKLNCEYPCDCRMCSPSSLVEC
eukprot:TRINITY_DN12398_c0_g2_i1.p1 TRINITY_DN12398_c0_g2~~TRINITY_DN12398_c0_g2_i1.p1  ORF type:complete len:200 (+),score=41.48 TRINITY_DN12398_c0_g2_i1:147-746(+)